MLMDNKLDDLIILRGGDDDPDAVTPDAYILATIFVAVFNSLDDVCPPPNFVTRVRRYVTCHEVFVTQLA